MILNKISEVIWSIKLRQRLPQDYFIEPGTICNLHCPLCVNGAGMLKKKKFMSMKNFKAIIEKIPKNRFIGLYNYGEPFLNQNIIEMIEYAKTKGHFIEISSNFNLREKDYFFQRIVDSKLDRLILSIDGNSQETYQKYRIGGNFNLVMKNLKTIVKLKKENHSLYPKIIWRFMVHKYNEHEVKKAQKRAKKLGIDFIVAKIGLSDDLPDVKFKETIEQRKKYWLPKNPKYRHYYYNRVYYLPFHNHGCKYLFNAIFIGPDGEIFPCCEISDKKYSFGNLLKEDLKKIWNNEKYKSARGLFRKGRDPTTNIICFHCRTFQKLKKYA